MRCSSVKKILLLGLLALYISEVNSDHLGATSNNTASDNLTTSESSLEGEWSTCWLLRKYGYDCETHKVTTADGYILTMFRVLCPNANIKETTSRPVAFLMHGLLCSSSIWTLSPERSLAMTMCDSGYDVWLGNARGNEYSLEHIYLNISSPNYWMFSWSDIAAIDLPEMMNYTIKYTGQDKLTYIGHSQGTTVFLALASTNRELAESLISSAHLLAPVAFLDYSGLLIEMAELYGLPDPNSSFVEVEVSKNLLTLVNNLKGQTYCIDTKLPQRLCEEVFEMFFGDSPLANKTALSDLFNTFPSSASTRQLKHYLQEYVSSKFQLYDFGNQINLGKYGSEEIPQYSVGKITVPTYLYYSDSDYIYSEEDVKKLISLLNPNTFRVAHYFAGFYHIDYFVANNLKSLLYSKIMEDIKNI